MLRLMEFMMFIWSSFTVKFRASWSFISSISIEEIPQLMMVKKNPKSTTKGIQFFVRFSDKKETNLKLYM